MNIFKGLSKWKTTVAFSQKCTSVLFDCPFEMISYLTFSTASKKRDISSLLCPSIRNVVQRINLSIQLKASDLVFFSVSQILDLNLSQMTRYKLSEKSSKWLSKKLNNFSWRKCLKAFCLFMSYQNKVNIIYWSISILQSYFIWHHRSIGTLVWPHI